MLGVEGGVGSTQWEKGREKLNLSLFKISTLKRNGISVKPTSEEAEPEFCTLNNHVNNLGTGGGAHTRKPAYPWCFR